MNAPVSSSTACALIVAFGLSAALATALADPDWFSRIESRLEELVHRADTQAQRARQAIVAADRLAAQSRAALSAAQASGDPAAREQAQRAALRASEARSRAEQLYAAALRDRAQAQQALAALRQWPRERGAPGRALLVAYGGRIRIAPATGPAADLEGSAPLVPLHGGERIETGPGAKLTLWLASADAQVSVAERTVLSVAASPEGEQLALSVGRLLLEIKQWAVRQRVKVTTPHAVIGVRGTRFALRHGEGEGTELIVLDGEVELHLAGDKPEPLTVRAGERLVVRDPAAAPRRLPLPDPGAAEEAWWNF